MRKTLFPLILVLAMILSTTSVFAGHIGGGDRDRDRLKDGSCLVVSCNGSMDRIQDRLRDLSCLS